MKKSILIITVIALICMGCGREERGMLTQRGKKIHDSWLNATNQVIENDIIPIFHLDAWIMADSDITRYNIEDKYFTYQRIRQEGPNVYAIYYGAKKVITVNTYGQSINDNGSHWLVTKHNESYNDYGMLPQFFSYPEGEKLHISKEGDQWRIQMDSAECMGSSCDLHIKPLGDDVNVLFSKGSYTLYGHGSYKYISGPVLLQYDIQSPLIHGDTLNNYFSNGIVQLLAQLKDPTKENENIPVKVEYLGRYSLRITYCNITETW